MNTDIIDKFTTHLKNVLTRALCIAVEAKEEEISPLHLLFALASQKGSIGAEILNKVKITGPKISKDSSSKEKKEKIAEAATPHLAEASKRTIEKAVLAASMYDHKYVGTEHLLSGLLSVEDEAVNKFFEDNKVELKAIRQQVTHVLKSTSKFPDLAASLGLSGGEFGEMSGMPTGTRGRRGKKGGSKTPALDFFSVDLTNADIQVKIDPVIGRDEEIERTMQILCRRTKNNPILLGDPGVGKTALVEGLAKKIVSRDVPEVLQGRRLLALDLSLIIAGTMYRGEFEGRLKQIIDEVKANPEIILFIDEVHTIMGAGSASGSLDAANILKPALARGEIRCIGATTLAEYKKHIETDAALERRFQSVMVSEPTPEKTIKILDGIKKNYETYHGVTICKDAITAAVELSGRYVQDKFFPDKAIDLIDEAASSMRVKRKASPIDRKIRELEEEITRVSEEKRQAVINEHFIEAISLKEQERALEEELKKNTKRRGNKSPSAAGRITARHIAEIVSRMTGVPTAELLDSERERLKNLEQALGARVLGQPTVVHSVAEFVRRAKTGINNPSRPLASFLFIGPSGVGKTELAKVLAELVFEDKDALIRLDMSEFSEGFTISKLIGAPAGYVGYKESAKLTDAVKRRPYSVVLFDELEKAHGDVLNLLLQILDEGHITDATGRKINFKNTIVIMTSNIGSERLREKEREMGFTTSVSTFKDLRADMAASLADRFRPEFLNRIDCIGVFGILDNETLAKIVDLQIAELDSRLTPRQIRVTITPEVREWIVKQGARAEQGARAMRRVIQTAIEGQIAAILLESSSTDPREFNFVLKDDKPFTEVSPL